MKAWFRHKGSSTSWFGASPGSLTYWCTCSCRYWGTSSFQELVKFHCYHLHRPNIWVYDLLVAYKQRDGTDEQGNDADHVRKVLRLIKALALSRKNHEENTYRMVSNRPRVRQSILPPSHIKYIWETVFEGMIRAQESAKGILAFKFRSIDISPYQRRPMGFSRSQWTRSINDSDPQFKK